MTFDPVKSFIESKRQYADARGIVSVGSLYYPITTTADAFVFSRDFFNATQKSEDGILERGSQALAKAFGAGPTSSYENAVKAWKATWPSAWDAAMKGTAPFWNNQAFWDAGHRYAIARSAVGAVPGHWGILVESVKESAADLAKAIVPRIDWWKWGMYGLAGFLAYQAISGVGGRVREIGAGHHDI